MSDSERFDRAIEKLLADESPTSELSLLDPEEQRMVRMAQLLRGSRSQGVSPEFVEDLHQTIFPRQPRRVSRRTAFLSGLGALAAGVLAGIGLDRSTRDTSTDKAGGDLVGANGKWITVARLADVPDGSVRTFSAGAVQGFLINRNGNFRALSRICTHMGCALNFEQRERTFQCPCHGAEFDLHGRLRYGPGGKYDVALPPLPNLQVRVKDESVEVWAV